MNIEPIDLKPVSTPWVRWLWGVNALWIVTIVASLAWWQWRATLTTDQQALVSARTQALAASAALLIKREEDERKAKATQPLKNESPFDWDEVLRALEDTQVNGVSVDSFRVDAAKKEANVVLTFKDYAQVGDYQEQMNAHMKSHRCTVLVAERREEREGRGRSTLACAW